MIVMGVVGLYETESPSWNYKTWSHKTHSHSPIWNPPPITFYLPYTLQQLQLEIHLVMIISCHANSSLLRL